MSVAVVDFIFNAIGTTGVVIILIAYFMLQLDKIDKDKLLYSAMNLVGAVFMMISLLRFWNLPSVIIEVFWISISIYGIVKYFKNNKVRRKNV